MKNKSHHDHSHHHHDHQHSSKLWGWLTEALHTHGEEHDHGLQTEGHVIRWAGLYDHVVNVLAMGKEAELRQLTVELAQAAVRLARYSLVGSAEAVGLEAVVT